MKFNQKINTIIYGAGLHGEEIMKVLLSFDFTVIAFIDINADKIQSKQGIPVYTLEKIPELMKSYKNLVYVISINNVFKHIEIATELAQKGAKYIIYKNLYHLNQNALLVNNLYDELNDELISPNGGFISKEVPLFKDTLDTAFTDYANDEAETVLCQVPIELLFGLTKEYYLDSLEIKNTELINLCPDRSLLYYSINKELFQFFVNGTSNNEWEDILELYLRQRRYITGNLQIDVEEEKQHIQDRYNIFQNMEVLYSSNISFFYNNPLYVAWNSKGYFNIQDGNNRAAFLLAKGWHMLPCRMLTSDYKKWVNEKEIANVDNILTSQKEVEYLIPHPYYNTKVYQSIPYATNKLKKICDWMYINKIESHDLKVLDIACRNGYWGQCFSKMGAVVTAIETDNTYYHLCRAVNKLLYNTTEKVYSSFELLQPGSYDIILIPLWANDKLAWAFNTSSKYIIIDTMNKDEAEYLQTLNNEYSGQLLCTLIYNGEMLYTTILTKR